MKEIENMIVSTLLETGLLEATTLYPFKANLKNTDWREDKYSLIEQVKDIVLDYLLSLRNEQFDKIASKLAFRIVNKEIEPSLSAELCKEHNSGTELPLSSLGINVKSTPDSVKSKELQFNTRNDHLFERLFKTNSSSIRAKLREDHLLNTEPSFAPSTLLSAQRIKEDFNSRQQKFLKEKQLHQTLKQTERTMTEEKKHPFSPKINKFKPKIKFVKTEASPVPQQKTVRKVDLGYLDKLSRSTSPKKKENLYAKVMKEEGCTFTPKTNKNRQRRRVMVSNLPSTRETTDQTRVKKR